MEEHMRTTKARGLNGLRQHKKKPEEFTWIKKTLPKIRKKKQSENLQLKYNT